MMKRFRKMTTWLLVLAVLLGMLPGVAPTAHAASFTSVTVGGVDALRSPSGSGWSYDAATGTLTITGNISGAPELKTINAETAPNSQEVLTINVTGNATITGSIYAGGKLRLVVDPGVTLTVNSSGYDAIESGYQGVSDSLTITGGGTVAAIATGTTNSGIRSGGGLTIENVTVAAQGLYGLDSGNAGYLYIKDNSKVYAVGNRSTTPAILVGTGNNATANISGANTVVVAGFALGNASNGYVPTTRTPSSSSFSTNKLTVDCGHLIISDFVEMGGFIVSSGMVRVTSSSDGYNEYISHLTDYQPNGSGTHVRKCADGCPVSNTGVEETCSGKVYCTAAVCDKCGQTFGTGDGTSHKGGEATCTAKAVCELCNTGYGELDPTNHSGEATSGYTYVDGTYHSAVFDCCNVTGGAEEEHTPSANDDLTCGVCGGLMLTKVLAEIAAAPSGTTLTYSGHLGTEANPDSTSQVMMTIPDGVTVNWNVDSVVNMSNEGNSRKYPLSLSGGGTLNLTGSIKNQGDSASVTLTTGSTVTLVVKEGGSVECAKSTAIVANGGTVIVEGGTVSGYPGYNGVAIGVASDADLTVTGGTVTAGTYGIQLRGSGTVSVGGSAQIVDTKNENVTYGAAIYISSGSTGTVEISGNPTIQHSKGCGILGNDSYTNGSQIDQIVIFRADTTATVTGETYGIYDCHVAKEVGADPKISGVNVDLSSNVTKCSGGTATCAAGPACDTCGTVYGTADPDAHTGGTATCQTKAVCKVCDTEYGSVDPANHEDTKPTCTPNAADSTKHDVNYCCCGTVVEEHSTTYSVNDATITASCTKCDAELGTAAISAKDATYTAMAYDAANNITVTGTGTLENQSWSYTYSGTANNNSTITNAVVAPTSAGSYEVSITVGEGDDAVTATASFTINKADPDIGTVSYTGTLYNSTDPTKVALTCVNNLAGTLVLTDTELKVGEGTYHWKFTPSEDNAYNYNEITGTVTLEVKEDTIQSISTSGTLTKSEYTYGEKFSLDGLTVTATYASGATKDVTSLVTYSTDLVAGQTSVELSYEDQTYAVTITVNKATPSVTAPTGKTGLSYTGEAQELVNAGTVTGGTMQYALYVGEYTPDPDNPIPDNAWTTEPPKDTDAKTYSVIYRVIGDKNHTDTEPKWFTVTIGPKTLTELTFVGLNKVYGHTGSAVEPKFTVQDGNTTLTVNTDYSVAITDNINVGTATITINLKGNYSGTVTKTFEIKNHEHDWSYTLNDAGDTITATCSGTIGECKSKTVTITLTAPKLTTYGGTESAAAVVTVDPIGELADPDVIYSGRNGTTYGPSGDAPTNAGDYTASITMGEGDDAKTASVTYTIERAGIYGASITTEIAPVVGEAPAADVNDDEGYTAGIEWNCDSDTFRFNTAYTATVTLTADSNHKFTNTLVVDGWTVKSVSTDGTTATLTKAFDATRKEQLTGIGTLNNAVLDKYYTNAADAAKELPANVTYTTESGNYVTADIEWACENYNSATKAINTFTWSVKDGELDNYDVNNIETSGSITVTNVDALPVTNTGSDGETTYDGNTYDVSKMFTKDANAGEASYAIADGGTGAGTLDGSTLTITKAGTIEITMNTAANGAYANGSATATLTVAKGTGEGTVTMDGWTYGGTASNPVAQSETNGAENVSYQYKVKDADDSTYTDSKPTNAGNYTVKATFAKNDLYKEAVATADFTIAKANAVITVNTTPIVKTYGDTWELPAATSTFGTPAADKKVSDMVNAGTYTVTYSVEETDNWLGAEKTVSVTINPAKVTKPAADTTVFTYNGNPQTYGVTETADYTVTNGTQTAANEDGYTVIISLKDKDNTVWDDGTVGDLTHTFKINRKAIETVVGVTAPVTAQTAQTTISGENYSGTVKWNPDVTTFGYYTAYTATVTLTADINYKFADSITLADYDVSVSNNGNTLTLTRTFEKTAKAKITSVTAPSVEKLAVYGTLDDALNAMPKTIEIETEAGKTTLPITWEIVGEYDQTPEVTNTFKWTANVGDYDVNGKTTSGTLDVANADVLGVSNSGTPAEITYDGNTFDVSTMFTKDTNAGEASYEIVVLDTEGEGTATLGEDGKTLTITKAGVITVKMTTKASGAYAEGSAQTTLTVKLGVGVGDITLESWTYGETAKTPVITSETNGTDNVTYLYESTDGKGYNSNVAPTAAGAYKVTATFAATDLYAKTEDSAEFTVEQAEPAVKTAPTATRIQRGKKLEASTIKGGEMTGVDGNALEGTFTWKAPETVMDTKGNIDVVVVFTPNDTANYEAVEITISVEVYYNVPIIVTPTYPPVVDGGDNGDVDVSPKNPEKGDTVTITPKPDTGYEVDEVIVKDKDGNPIDVTDNGDGTYSFKQPSGKVTISVTFKELVTTCPRDHTCPMYGYTDLDRTEWYHDGIHFCIEHGLMLGIGDNQFAPHGNLSRAMLVTILWRLEGKPVVNYLMTFEDVDAESWYGEAVRWAASEGIVLGYDAESFGPNDDITREQLATILYRYEQYKGGGFVGAWMFRMDYADLADVSDWAYEAMCWNTMNGIVNGKPGKILDPKGTATRAEAAAMLNRYCEKENNK